MAFGSLIRRFALLLLGLLAAGEAAAQHELVVRLRTSASGELRAALEGVRSKRSAEILRGVNAVQRQHAAHPSFLSDVFVLELPKSADPEEVRRRWADRPGVAYVHPNYVYTLDALAPAADDPLLDSLHHLDVIRAFEAWSASQGEDVVIGFVDTGLYTDHPELHGQRWLNIGEDADGDGPIGPADFNGVDDDGNGYVDDVYGYDFVDRPNEVEPGDFHERDPHPDESPGEGNGHGTLVAGVLAAAAGNGVGGAGVAPRSRLLTLRAFGNDGRGEDDDVSAAIVYAADADVDVLNLSFGDVYYSPLMHDAIRYAVDRGVVVVASAGNVGGDDPHYPSDYPEVISVAWLNQDGTDTAGRGTHGVGIELGAPATAVYTTRLPPMPGSSQQEALYGRYSGSSLAAPMVAATAALVLARAPELSPASLRSVLTASARDIRDEGWDHYTGAGRLDAAEAVLRALPAETQIHHPDEGEGVAAETLAIVGTAIDPSFSSYQLFVGRGIEAPLDWTALTESVSRQVARDTLAWWETATLEEGVYTLRLVTRLRGGSSVEDRRRVYVDRSEPLLQVRLLDAALVEGAPGVAAEVITDDLTRVWMEVEGPQGTAVVSSDREAGRHGLQWQDARGRGDAVRVRLVAENTVGLTTSVERTVDLLAGESHPAWLSELEGWLPDGYLLPEATDFDADGLLEVTMNPFRGGSIIDTLLTFEWSGSGFRRAAAVPTPLKEAGDGFFAPSGAIPRDVGDMDGDGLRELLGSSDFGSILLEQEGADTFPARLVLRDDTSRELFGARLVDLTGDGRDELLAHDGINWSVYVWSDGSLHTLDTLPNPTDSTGGEASGNELQQPRLLVHDLDSDGRTEILMGDNDGDLVLYSWADGQAEVVWTHETDRYNAGSRFAHGDFDGDGQTEVVTYAENWKGARGDDEHEPPHALYFLWRAEQTGLVLLDSLPVVAGDLSNHNVLRTVDFEQDGRPELVLVHPPDLFVLTVRDGRFEVVQQRGERGAGAGFRSIQAVDADFDGDGVRELLVGRSDGRLVRLAPSATGTAMPPPAWVRARALDGRTVELAWRAPGADSVTVFGSADGGDFDALATTTGDTTLIGTEATVLYTLRAWYADTPSPLAGARRVRPHAPGRVLDAKPTSSRAVRIAFSEVLADATRPASFTLDEERRASSVILTDGGVAALVSFDSLALGRHTLYLHGLVDAEDTPLADTTLVLQVHEEERPELIVASWEIVSTTEVEVTFNAALDPAAARDASRYLVQPGRVHAVSFDEERPDRVVVEIDGRVLGATGLATTLAIRSMRGARGERLADEGAALRLVEPARSLADAYVFPNPIETRVDGERMMVAGLPANADVRVFSAEGTLVRRLEERDGDGGTEWDLRADDGTPVPSGVYLVRIEAEGESPILKKAAVIR